MSNFAAHRCRHKNAALLRSEAASIHCSNVPLGGYHGDGSVRSSKGAGNRNFRHASMRRAAQPWPNASAICEAGPAKHVHMLHEFLNHVFLGQHQTQSFQGNNFTHISPHDLKITAPLDYLVTWLRQRRTKRFAYRMSFSSRQRRDSRGRQRLATVQLYYV